MNTRTATQVAIVSLELTNFKGARHVQMGLDGRSASIYGDNATGKTTLADAWCWLLTGKDSSGSAEIGVKTLEPSGEAKHHLDHSVTAVLSVGGEPLTLARTMREKWTRKKGAPAETFSGHEGSFAVDGVPVTERQFSDKIAEICPARLLPILTRPAYFAGEMDWKQRRAMLLEMAGDVKPDAIFAANPELEPLAKAIGRHSVSDYKAILAQEAKAINGDLKVLPGRIEEASRSAACDEIPAEVEAAVRQATAELEDAQRTEAALEAAGPEAEIRARLREAENRLKAAQLNAQAEANNGSAARSRAIREASAAIESAKSECRSAEARRGAAQMELERLTAALSAKDAEWQAASSTAMPEFTGDAVCAACGQPLAQDRVQAAREAHESYHKTKLSRQLAAISAEQDIARRGVKRAGEELANAANAAAKAAMDLGLANGAMATAEAMPVTQASPESLAAVESAGLEVSGLKDKLASVQADGSALFEAAKAATAARRLAFQDAMERSAKISASRAAKDRVAELEAKNKLLAQRYEEVQQLMWLCDRYVVTWVEAMEAKVNGLFRHVRIKLFRDQVNGGVEEMAEVTYQGVGYQDLNGAAKVNAALDINNAVSQFFGVHMPIWLDGRESCTRIIPTPGSQVISLFVSAQDNALRLVLGEELANG